MKPRDSRESCEGRRIFGGFECLRKSQAEGSSRFSGIEIQKGLATIQAMTDAKKKTIRLNKAGSELFLKALVAPPAEATPRMARALKLHRKTVTER